jgi:hypothetical protein
VLARFATSQCVASASDAGHVGAPVDKIPIVSSPKRVDRTPRLLRLGAGVKLKELRSAQMLEAMIDESALEDVALREVT